MSPSLQSPVTSHTKPQKPLCTNGREAFPLSQSDAVTDRTAGFFEFLQQIFDG